MTFDYKKEYKDFYQPKNKPEIIAIPKMNFIAVNGKGMTCSNSNGHAVTLISPIFHSFLEYRIRASNAT